ncbi:Cyclic pyranopterin monophosphate synthase [Streptomyces alboniger]
MSSYVSFELFVRPAIHPDGLYDVHPPRVRAKLTAGKALTSPKGRRQFLRGMYADGAVTPVGGAGSHLVAALAHADALIVVPEDVESVEPGSEVEVVLLGELRGSAPLDGSTWRYRVAHSRPARRARTGSATQHDSAFPGETPGPSDRLTHIDEAGAARMVDVSGKDVTARTASASGRVLVSPRVIELLRGEGVPKGDALATARIAGIMGAKRTRTSSRCATRWRCPGRGKLDLRVADDAVEILATVKTTDRTGVEMEALTAVSVAALTVIDMIKAVDKGAVITDVRVEEKTGGKSGDWSRA